jgi:hypothetical protein
MLESARGQYAEAEKHLATMTAVVRDFAIPRGEASCLIGFAKVALDRGDYARASRLLTTVDSSVGSENRPFVTALDPLIYAHSTDILRRVFDLDTARTTRADGASLSLKEALDAELARSSTTATTNPPAD